MVNQAQEPDAQAADSPAIGFPAEDLPVMDSRSTISPAMDFEEVWALLPRLEGEAVTTAAYHKPYKYRIVEVSPKGVLRQTIHPQPKRSMPGAAGDSPREALVGKTYFSRFWDRLTSVGVGGMRTTHAGFIAACLYKLPQLGVWYASGGKDWDYCNLLVLGNPASRVPNDGAANGARRKSHDWVSEHIVREPLICGGVPTIRGTRIMVWNILGMFDGGYDTSKILQTFHWITREDVEAALEYSRIETEDGRLIATR